MPKRKLVILALTSLALLAMLLLANGLQGLTLKPGTPLSFGRDFILSPGEVLYVPGGEFFIFLMRLVFLLAWLGLPFAIILLVISGDARRKLLRFLSRTVPYILVFVIGAKVIQMIMSRGADVNPLVLPGGAAGEGDLPPPILEYSGQPPAWLVTVASLLLAALVLGGLLLLFRRLRPRPVNDKTAITRIVVEAQAALDEISAGGDLRSAILRCYAEMSRVAQEQRGLSRESAMTPREFEAYLSGHGLPAAPVRDLTRLFEDTRYGAQPPGEREERLALESLSAIIASVRGAA